LALKGLIQPFSVAGF